MATKVALLLLNGVLPAQKFQSELDELGYACIMVDQMSSGMELPVFNLAVVGINKDSLNDRIWQLSQKHIEKPFLYYCGENYSDSWAEYYPITKANFISPNFTLRELELAIELCQLQRKLDYAATFSDTSPNSNHVRLKKLLSEEQAWRVLFEQSPNGVLLSDSDGNIVYTNHAAGDILGYSSQELIKMRFHDLVPHEITSQVDQNIRKILDGEALLTEVYNVRKDGTKRFVQLHETRVIFPDGNFGIMVVSTDISRAKHAEEALLESMEKYRILVERSNDGIIYAKDGIITYGNPRIMEMIRITNDEFVGKPISFFVHPNEKQKILNRYQRRLQGYDEPSIYETRLVNSLGESISVEFNVNLTQLRGELITMVFIRDVSLRKESEKALRESEESYRGLFDNASEAIYILDSSGIFLDVNSAGQKLYGYTKNEIAGFSPEDLSAPGLNDLSDVKRKIHLAFQGQTQTLEFWGRKKNGEVFPKEIILSKGNYFGLHVVMAMARDISERKNAEEVLRESEDKYRTLTEQIPIGLYRISTKGEIIYSNLSFARILGFTNVENLVGRNISEFTTEKFVEHTALSDGQDADHSDEILMHRIDGNVIWVRNQIHVNYALTGEIQYFDGVMSDITDRKLAIDAMRESEEKFRAMIMAIPDQLFRITDTGVLVDFAPSDQVSYPRFDDTMIGENISRILSLEVSQQFADAIAKCKATSSLQTFEYQIAAENKVYFFESRIVPSSNNILLVLQRDITQRKKIEEEIRMLAQAIMNANDSISITDLDDNFIFVNPAFTRTYGYTSEEIIGKNTMVLRNPDFDREIGKKIQEETGKTGWQGELINVRKDGSIFPIYLSTSAVYDEVEKPIAFVGIANDITERKKTEQELIRAKEKAEESDRLKTAFLSNMSHEIRSPMNAVLGFIQLIKSDENLSETGKQYVELIQNSGNQLLSLIEDIIDISKIQSNQLRLSKNVFDLNSLLEELYLVFASQLKAKDMAKTYLFPPELANSSPFAIYTDSVRIRQILTNLLSNAMKFTPSGNIKFGYTVIIDDYFPRIQFFVKDTGIGISPENQLLVFERFRQADDTYTRLYGGSGLGLAISKGLVELLGGNIWVESQKGEGSEFYFTIPYQMDESDEQAFFSFNKFSGLEGKINLNGKTILVVEDTKDIRLYFERILERTGARVVFANNAKEARKKFKQEKDVSLVLLDIRLPDAEGYDLAMEFKRMRPNLPIIAQTAYALQSELNKSISSGCDDYITKPLDSEILYHKIHKLLDDEGESSP